MSDILLSPHFSLYELTRTDHREYLNQNLTMGQQHLTPLTELAKLLEGVRSVLGDHPLALHSGYRCPDLNHAIGGAPTSQHMKGEAADFHVVGADLHACFDEIRRSTLKWGQLLLEGHNGIDFTWLHISLGVPWRAQSQSQQAGTFDGKQYHWL